MTRLRHCGVRCNNDVQYIWRCAVMKAWHDDVAALQCCVEAWNVGTAKCYRVDANVCVKRARRANALAILRLLPRVDCTDQCYSLDNPISLLCRGQKNGIGPFLPLYGTKAHATVSVPKSWLKDPWLEACFICCHVCDLGQVLHSYNAIDFILVSLTYGKPFYYLIVHRRRRRGARGARAPLKFGKKIFGQFLCKIRAFFGQKSYKIRDFC